MNSRKFIAPNSQAAFKMIKESLGPDAMILSNCRTASGVEIVAGTDEEVVTQVHAVVQDSMPVDTGFDNSLESESHHQNTNLVQNAVELNELKTLLVSELSLIRIGEWENRDADRYRLFQELIGLGFGVSLIARLISVCEEGLSIEELRAVVLEEIAFSVNTDPGNTPDIADLSGVLVIHGANGAGKTTTVAKIAREAIKQHGHDEVVILSADNQKIGAYQQLLGIGKLIGAPVLNVRKSWELNEILSALTNKRLVIVDSSGLTPESLIKPGLVPSLALQEQDVKHLLVMSATMQSATAAGILASPLADSMDGIVLTKTDETRKPAEILSCLIKTHSKVLYQTSGISIKNDVKKFFIDDYIEHIFSAEKSSDLGQEETVENRMRALLGVKRH